MNYNYVFFNAPDNRWGAVDDGFFTICLSDLKDLSNVHIVSNPMDYFPKIIQCLYKLHNSPRVNKFIKLRGKRKWYPYWFKHRFCDNKPICFIFACGYEEFAYFKYLKNKYPNCRIVKLHRDLVDVFLRGGHGDLKHLYDGNVKFPYDLLYLFDEKEAEKYGGKYSSFISYNSKIEVEVSKKYPLSDVFFAGRAKDRLPKLLDIYNRLTSLGLKVEYYLTGVPLEERKSFPGITYADVNLSYREMLYRSVNSRCMLDINQKDAMGFTERFLEAVMYNKKLITDNAKIKEHDFYDERFIQYIDNAKEIDVSFIENNINVDYGYNNEFSPIHLIEDIDLELEKLDKKDNKK